MLLHSRGTAQTIALEMKRIDAGLTCWDNRTVLIVDEAAQLSTKNMADLATKAKEAGASVPAKPKGHRRAAEPEREC